MKHTPIPWKAADKIDEIIPIDTYNEADETTEICQVSNDCIPDEEQEANAALIVEAVNSYEANKAKLLAFDQLLGAASVLLPLANLYKAAATKKELAAYKCFVDAIAAAVLAQNGTQK